MTINPRTDEAYQLFLQGTLAFARAEMQGIHLDITYCERQKRLLTNKINDLEEEFKQTTFYKHWEHSVKGTVNINSDTQLRHFLYDIKKYKIPKYTYSGQGATDAKALSQLNIPELEILVQRDKLKRLRDVNIDGFLREQVNGVIHPFFNLHLAHSYRSSSNSPNFQNIPVRDEESMKICRRALYPRSGHQLLEVDFKSIEVAINACVVGSTLVETIDGSQTIKTIINRVKNKEDVFVYGYDYNKERICVEKVSDGQLTRIQTEIWSVKLDNGQEIKATPDHRFMLRTGEYVSLIKLKKGDSLMPFYKKNKKSRWGTIYEEIYLNNGQKILAHISNERKKGEYITSEKTKEKLRITSSNRIISEKTKEKLKLNWKIRKAKGKNKECNICHKKFISISPLHLKNIHNISFKEYKETYNHKVVSIEFVGYEDVYNLNVENIHNYALSAGIVIKNSINKDTNLLKYCRNPNSDMHGDMARQIFKLDKPDKILRYAAKNGFVFPEFYGDYYVNCAENMACNLGKLPKSRWKEGEGIPLDGRFLADHMISKGFTSLKRFEDHVKKVEDDFWGNRFSEYKEWKDRWYNTYKKYGYFDLPTGFRCSGVLDKKQVCNLPAQGSAFHCLLWSFIRVDEIMRKEKWDSRLIGQIHDSMTIDVLPSELTHVVKTIEKITTQLLPEAWKWIIVPMMIEMELTPIDGSWSDKEEYNAK